MIYVRDTFTCELVNVAQEVESLWVKVTDPKSTQIYFINATYHPPNSRHEPLIDFLSKSAEDFGSKDNCKYSNLIIGGDFNKLPIDELEFECGVSRLQTQPTRGDATLDFILINRPDLVQSAECIAPSFPSDHLAVIMKPTHRIPPNRRKVEFTDFCPKGHNKLNELMQASDFQGIADLANSNIEKAAELMEEKISSLVREAYPQRTVVISDRDPSWMTPKAKWLLNKRKRARNKYKNKPTQALDNQLKKIKSKHLCKNPNKSLWTTVDHISHRKVSNNSINHNEFDSNQLNIDLAARSSNSSPQRTLPIISFNQIIIIHT